VIANDNTKITTTPKMTVRTIDFFWIDQPMFVGLECGTPIEQSFDARIEE